MRRALKAFDRRTAAAVLESMEASRPEARVTAYARIALARYDASPTQLLAAFQSMLELFPKDSTALLSKVGILKDINRREERLALARAQEIDGDPIFCQHLGQLLLADPATHDEAIRVLRRAIRRRPFAAGAWYLLGNVLWEQREFTESAEIYRFSACLEERDEQFADAYVRAARVLEQSAEAMRFLKTRFQRTKGKLASPARALLFAMSEADECEAAFALIEEAAVPADPGKEVSCWQLAEVGDLMLFHADIKGTWNEPEAAAHILADARAHTQAVGWLRTSARNALLRSDFVRVRQYWQAIVDIDPFHSEGYRTLARAILECEGRPAALAWLRDEADTHQHHYPLQGRDAGFGGRGVTHGSSIEE